MKTLKIFTMMALIAVSISVSSYAAEVEDTKKSVCIDAATEKLETAGWTILDYMYLKHEALREATAREMCEVSDWKTDALVVTPEIKETIKEEVAEQERLQSDMAEFQKKYGGNDVK